MVRRPDLVLAAIPLLALSGVLVERFAPLVASSGVGRAVTRLPLPALGFLSALAVIAYAMFRVPGATQT